jgi:hypothetical protein
MDEELLPLNQHAWLPNGAPERATAEEKAQLFVGGDERANENVMLTALHTLWVREHNRIVDQIRHGASSSHTRQPSGEELYQTARRMVSALLQHIAFNEWLPVLLGERWTPPSHSPGYQTSVNPGVSVEFSTAAFRFGHGMLPSVVFRSDPLSGAPLPPLLLKDAFFQPDVVKAGGVDSLLLGAVSSRQKQLDGTLVDGLRNMLFGPVTSTMLLDLGTLNIMRGRDRGLPSYCHLAAAYGLPVPRSFHELRVLPSTRAALASLYDHVCDIDPWVVALCELPGEGGGLVGPLAAAIVAEQFSRTRQGDRFWYEHDASLQHLMAEIQATTFGDVIRRNLGHQGGWAGDHLTSGNVFFVRNEQVALDHEQALLRMEESMHTLPQEPPSSVHQGGTNWGGRTFIDP